MEKKSIRDEPPSDPNDPQFQAVMNLAATVVRDLLGVITVASTVNGGTRGALWVGDAFLNGILSGFCDAMEAHSASMAITSGNPKLTPVMISLWKETAVNCLSANMERKEAGAAAKAERVKAKMQGKD